MFYILLDNLIFKDDKSTFNVFRFSEESINFAIETSDFDIKYQEGKANVRLVFTMFKTDELKLLASRLLETAEAREKMEVK